MGPYAYLRDQWVSFDDIAMIRLKSEYIKAMGLGGGMIWALDLDDFKNICDCENYPLLRTINRVLRNYAKPAPKCILGGSEEKPMQKPTKKPTFSTTTMTSVYPDEFEPVVPGSDKKMPCQGRLYIADENNCNQYYLCNQGTLELQACPIGLYWNKDHCDWPENTECHPDGTTSNLPSTTEGYYPPEEEGEEEFVLVEEETPRPSYPGTEVQPVDGSSLKVVCYFTNWAWYR